MALGLILQGGFQELEVLLGILLAQMAYYG